MDKPFIIFVLLIIVILVILSFAYYAYFIFPIKRQNCIRKMLIDVVDILNCEQVPYWADYGTLLGIIREGDIIKYDYDADLGIKDTDMHLLDNPHITAKLNEAGYIMTKSVDNAYKIYSKKDVGKSPVYASQVFAHVDIFIFEETDEGLMRNCSIKWKGQDCDIEYNKKDSIILDLMSDFIMFYVKKWHTYVRIPKKYVDVAEYRYGKTWVVPKFLDHGPRRGLEQNWKTIN